MYAARPHDDTQVSELTLLPNGSGPTGKTSALDGRFRRRPAARADRAVVTVGAAPAYGAAREERIGPGEWMLDLAQRCVLRLG